MNIKQLRFAKAVSITESFSKAAELCHVTQPTLSNAITQLESELGNKLFERTTRSVSLTPFGSHILPIIERAISEIDEIGRATSAWDNSSHKLIKLGLSPVIDMHRLQNILGPFRKHFPDIEFFYKECYLNDLDNRLRLGQLDIIFMPERTPYAGNTHIKLYSENLYYVPCNGSNIAGHSGEAVSLSDAANENLILTIDACGLRSATQTLFSKHQLRIKEYPGQATTYSVVEDWAALGIGAGILPKSKISTGNPYTIPLLLDTDKQASITCEAVWTSQENTPEHIKAFIKHLESVSV